ncbi:MAG: SIR2 family protein [Bacteroidales bacterium]|jgi:NAD-dependent SIR2 family protein deacetylase|nr:SIR2 family protein [Bacteroidales bacterium]
MIYSISEVLPKLEKLMEDNMLSIFAGSGVSIDSGLPTWDGLIDKFIDLLDTLPFNKELEAKKNLDKLITDSRKRKEDKRFDPILVATSLKRAAKNLDIENKNNPLARSEYLSWVSREFVDKKPNECHSLIVNTDYQFILTTNYDLLFEKAAQKDEIYDIWDYYSYKNPLEVMSSIHSRKKSVIHVHGTASDLSLDELIFTKEDYNKMIHKKFDAFSFALRILFTRFSTLFVGYGASDPHLDEVFEEISEYFPLQNSDDFKLPQSYILMKEEKIDSLFESNCERLRIDIIKIKNYSENKDILTYLKDKFPIK